MKKLIFKTAGILIFVAAVIFAIIYAAGQMPPSYESATTAQKKILDYAKKHDLSWSDYPESLVALLERNPETEQFVLEYPTAHTEAFAIDLTEYKNAESVPLFMQWDQRWGYIRYGSDMAALTGCGPVCLSMTAFYLTNDSAFSPDKMLRFAMDNDYYVPGSGSSWTLISEGGKKLGFDVKELPLDENRIVKSLNAGSPVICVMGPGDFTDSGHYIVITGTADGKLQINDPNSRANSGKLWEYEAIKGQIRNLWSIGLSKP